MKSFEQLRQAFPHFKGCFAPPWGLPTLGDFARIDAERGTLFPESFVAFQTHHALHLPSFPDGFRWANAGLEPYLSLEDLIDEARAFADLPADFTPFADDEGDYLGFSMVSVEGTPEPPVARWDHASQTLCIEATCFTDWLWQRYAAHERLFGVKGTITHRPIEL